MLDAPLFAGVDRPRLKILHVLAPARVGGLEGVVRSLAVGHQRAGHTVHIAAVVEELRAAEDLALQVAREGVVLHPVVLPPRAYLRERAAIEVLCDRIGADVVHTHGYRTDVLDAQVARRRGIPTVTTVHGFTGKSWRDRVYELIQRRVFRRFDAVIAVSRPLRERLLACGVSADRVHLVPNVPPEVPHPLERAAARVELGAARGTYHLGWVGRLSLEKGCDLLLDALARVRDLSLVVSIIGDGPERIALEQRARALGLFPRIRWQGILPDAARLFPAFEALVLSSRTEGTPLVLLEAMAAGVPIIATRVGGVCHMLADDEAWLVDAGSPSALADAIRAVHARPAEAAARAGAARRRVEAEHRLDPWLARHEAIYRSLVPSITRSARCPSPLGS